ncbi:MAG: T9SS type A sorting domain-containing protein [Flavobacteriaceae bacterium]|nr:T9SS type A sorting domain-containing protein [Flavobacteriaceae bacterium]
MKHFITKNLLLLFASCCIGGASAQINYSFINGINTTQTWVDISGNGSSISTANNDDANSSPENIGFDFDFNGNTYTQFVLNTNGFIKLGPNAPSAVALFYSTAQGNTGDALGSTASGDSSILAPFNMDLQPGAQGNTEYRVYTSGSSPNQICTIQFSNVMDKLTAAGVPRQFDNISFQIKLYETSNIIEFVYGPHASSSNAPATKTTAVGIKGSAANTSSIVTVFKTSVQNWSAAAFLQGNYTGLTHNVRNTFLADSGRTYRFMPNSDSDIAVIGLYSLGRMPIPFSNPHRVKIRVFNSGKYAMSNYWVYLKNTVNGNMDSVEMTNSVAPNEIDSAYLHVSPSLLGYDTLIAYVANDDYAANDQQTWVNDINPNAFSYSDATKGPTGGVGSNSNPLDFVAKFYSNTPVDINQIRVNFLSTNLPYSLTIWEDSTNGLPLGVPTYISSSKSTLNGLAVSSVNPPISVSGTFFVGVRQLANTNVAFAFQAENPIRDSTFYSKLTTNAGWIDFSSYNGGFRFMIEPRLMLKNDVGVIKMVSPTNDTCVGGKQALTFQIQNLGTDTIDLLSDSILVYADVTDPNQNTTTYGPVILNKGTLASNDTMDVTLTTNFDYSVNGDYTFSAYTVMVKDSNQLNDTLPIEKRTSTGASALAFASSSAAICPGDTIVLTSGQSYGGVLFNWYKDGNLLPNSSDTVWYATSAGKYVCEVANGYGCIAYSDTLVVNQKNTPSPNLNVSAQGFCPGDSVSIFTQGGGGNYSFQWMNSGGNINGATDSIYYTSTADDYSVWVKDNTSGCSATSGSFTISAFNKPTASVTVNGNTKLCLGDSTELDGSASTGTYFQWFKDGVAISGATNSNYYVTSTGDYQLQSTSTQGCKDITSKNTLTVDSLPSASMTTHTGKYKFCDLDSLQFITPNISGYSYQWNDQFGPIQGATNSTYTLFTAGDVGVTVINSAGCSATVTPVSVTVDNTPNADLNAVTRNQFCGGDSERIELTTPASGQAYQWQLNGTTISGDTNTVIYAKSQGDYTLQVTVVPTGCINVSNTVSLTVDVTPDPKIINSTSLTFCQGDSVKLEISANGSLQTIDWKKDGVSIGQNGSLYYASTSGNYTVYAEGTNGCNGTSAASTVVVNALPAASFTDAGAVLTANSGAGLLYQWYKDGSIIPGATAQTFTMTSHGSYTVEITDANGCKMMSAAKGFNIGMALPEGITSLDVYPNPSTGVFVIKSQHNKNLAVSLKVIDMIGRSVISQTNLGLTGNTIIDLSSQPAGVYMLQVATSGSVYSVRIVKQ